MERVLIDVINVINNSLGASGFSPEQAVLGRGIPDVASEVLGEGDHQQDDDVLQDPSTRGPFSGPLGWKKLPHSRSRRP